MTYVFEISAWGKGYATEIAIGIRDYALEKLGLKRIIALIDPVNTASTNVAIKTSMKWEKDVVRPGGKAMQVYTIKKL